MGIKIDNSPEGEGPWDKEKLEAAVSDNSYFSDMEKRIAKLKEGHINDEAIKEIIECYRKMGAYPDFSNCILDVGTFRGEALHDVDFSNSSLIGADFYGADLMYANFCGADLRVASFAKADLNGAKFDASTDASDAIFAEAKLMDAEMSGAHFEQCDFEFAKLMSADATGARFDKASMVRVDFSNAKLEKASFYKADLNSSNFHEAILHYTNFAEANLGNSTGFPLNRSSSHIILSQDIFFRYLAFIGQSNICEGLFEAEPWAEDWQVLKTQIDYFRVKADKYRKVFNEWYADLPERYDRDGDRIRCSSGVENILEDAIKRHEEKQRARTEKAIQFISAKYSLDEDSETTTEGSQDYEV